LPTVVSVGGGRGLNGSIGSGFLGVDYEPFVVQNPGQLPQDVAVPVATGRFERRLGLLNDLEDDFAVRGGEIAVADHKKLYAKTKKLVLSPDVQRFEIAGEAQEMKYRYGDSQFGRGCLLARRLVEAGVTYVEVRMGNWDTHQENFTTVSQLASQTDPGFAALVADLKQRGMLERTLVVW